MNSNESRKYGVLGFFGLLFFVLAAKLFHLQLIDQQYKTESKSVAVVEQEIIPARGFIYDRNDSLIVYNAPVYDIYITRSKLKKADTSALCNFLQLDRSIFDKKLADARKKNFWHKPYPLLRKLSSEDYAVIQEDMYKFPSLSVEFSTERRYTFPYAAHLLGYMGEVDEAAIEASEKYYSIGEYAGQTGMEKTYEEALRGTKGKRFVLRDKSNVVLGSFEDGAKDLASEEGLDLHTTLDIGLQGYGEQLMKGKIGSIVAIQPQTGDILAMVSSPTYNPNWLTGRQRSAYFSALLTDSLKPMFNRAIQAEYPPGSTFKPIASLIAMEKGAVTANFRFPCGGGYSKNRGKPGCHAHPALYGVEDAIKQSCNAYYAESFRRALSHSSYSGDVRKALDDWRSYMHTFGYDKRLNIGVGGVKTGHFPSSNFYDNIYKGWDWKPMTIISLSIGQGETLATTLQMANTMAAIGNKGYYFTPHLVKKFSDGTLVDEAVKRIDIPIEKAHFDPVVNGMEYTFINGTAAASKIEGIAACGKTGTAENFAIIDGKRVQLKDHSLFVAFAPKENPQIAIAVIIENGGYGSTYAAPIASLMMEKYIKGEIPENRKWWEDRMFNANLIGREYENYLEYIQQKDSLKMDLIAEVK
ncbi:MAG: penicillin-binding protein 2 [Saprospiraceae bacterium]|nr:penicillin-binding protein 2 [Saprospiraceae bacterium]